MKTANPLFSNPKGQYKANYIPSMFSSIFLQTAFYYSIVMGVVIKLYGHVLLQAFMAKRCYETV